MPNPNAATADDTELAEFGELLLGMPPDLMYAWLDTQPPETIDLAERVMGHKMTLGWRGTPATMAVHLDREHLQPFRYFMYLGEKFREAVEGTSTRQIWNLPSRMGKSLLASRWGPAWCLDRYPRSNLILASYGDDLAMENAVGVRHILREHEADMRVQLRQDRQRQDRFATTDGGGLLAGGIQSALTGFGAGDHGGVVLDDPFKNWQEAHSAARRDLVWNNYRAVIRFRLESPDAWVIVVMTRWHEDDLTGRLLAGMEDETGEPWDLVRLPAFAEECDPTSLDRYARMPDPLGRAPGEVLEPLRFDAEHERDRALAAGSYLTAAMLQQRPSPEEGGELKRAWWKIDSTMPTKWDDGLSSWDMKLKDNEAGDFVVGQLWVRTGADYWCLDQLRGQWNQSTTANAIALMAVRHPAIHAHVVENTGNGPEVMQVLREPMTDYTLTTEMAGELGMTIEEAGAVQALRRRGLPGLLPENPKGDKAIRVRAQSPYVEAGNVHLPEHASWLGTFLDEMSSFPNGSNDDQVDAWSQAMRRLARGPATATATPGRLEKPKIGGPRRKASVVQPGWVGPHRGR